MPAYPPDRGEIQTRFGQNVLRLVTRFAEGGNNRMALWLAGTEGYGGLGNGHLCRFNDLQVVMDVAADLTAEQLRVPVETVYESNDLSERGFGYQLQRRRRYDSGPRRGQSHNLAQGAASWAARQAEQPPPPPYQPAPPPPPRPLAQAQMGNLPPHAPAPVPFLARHPPVPAQAQVPPPRSVAQNLGFGVNPAPLAQAAPPNPLPRAQAPNPPPPAPDPVLPVPLPLPDPRPAPVANPPFPAPRRPPPAVDLPARPDPWAPVARVQLPAYRPYFPPPDLQLPAPNPLFPPPIPHPRRDPRPAAASSAAGSLRVKVEPGTERAEDVKVEQGLERGGEDRGSKKRREGGDSSTGDGADEPAPKRFKPGFARYGGSAEFGVSWGQAAAGAGQSSASGWADGSAPRDRGRTDGLVSQAGWDELGSQAGSSREKGDAERQSGPREWDQK